MEQQRIWTTSLLRTHGDQSGEKKATFDLGEISASLKAFVEYTHWDLFLPNIK